jgi:benzoate-CoA ligase
MPARPRRGELGSLGVKGDSKMAYDWSQREKTKAMLFGEWIHTGAKHRQDTDGYFWCCGHADDMLEEGHAPRGGRSWYLLDRITVSIE